jgi:hypothetical protein
MTKDQYDMSFGEWCNHTKGTNLKLDEFGAIVWNDPNKESVTNQYHDLWMAELKAYRLQEKNDQIVSALESIRKHGIECVLCNYQNGHIKAKTKHGRVLSYYATTGTIAGYWGTPVEGLDYFIEMCETK